MIQTITLHHNKIVLALHQFTEGDGHPLLVLHGLGEASSEPRGVIATWPGPVWGLDLTGHGESTVPRGGGYTCEMLMGDVDIALNHIGQATLYGRGLGAYLALQVGGARPDQVRGVVLSDGPGLAGGGATNVSGTWIRPVVGTGDAPDPFALVELSCDVRPPDYALSFVHLLMAESELETPLVVSARVRPPWLEAVGSFPGVVSESDAEALVRYSS